MKYCPECGQPLLPDQSYCSSCGLKIPSDLKEYSKASSLAKEYPVENLSILIAYCEQAKDSSTETPVYELVLYDFSDKQLLLQEKKNSGTEKENRLQWLVSTEAYEDALKVVKTFHLKELLQRRGDPLPSKTFVILFREDRKDPLLHRFSSDNVGAKETTMMFPQMHQTLCQYKQ